MEVLYYETDFSKHASVYEFAEWVNSRYKVDILVNNVGIGGTYSFTDTSAAYMDSLININVRTTALLDQVVAGKFEQSPPSLYFECGQYGIVYAHALQNGLSGIESVYLFVFKSIERRDEEDKRFHQCVASGPYDDQ